MIPRNRLKAFCMRPALIIAVVYLFTTHVQASYGDRLPEFQRCVQVCADENCADGKPAIPLLYKLLLWNCESECDYTCQHIITDQRIIAGEGVVQFHGKWPFYRFLGMQEPFSVLFSFFNFFAHYDGLLKIRGGIPSSYALRKYYVGLAYFGMASWASSMIFHTRDFIVTEQLDYLAAGASVLYGLHYTLIRMFRRQMTQTLVSFWTILCIAMYLGHVTYLKMYRWNYGYNMTANVTVGIIQNIMWSWFSVDKYMRSKRSWAAWPGLIVAWVLVVMSLELLDFPPLWGILDAHSLWHLGTVIPTWAWYKFLLKDAQDDIVGQRQKA